MKVEPSGVMLVDTCEIQTKRCVATSPAPITAVWTLPGRTQVNVCGACLDEQLRSGAWAADGARPAMVRREEHRSS